MKELVSLSEFSNLTRLSANNVLTLLERGLLKTELGEQGEVLVDISDIEPEELAKKLGRLHEAVELISSDLLTEAVATEVVHSLEPIINDALSLAIRWSENKPAKDSS